MALMRPPIGPDNHMTYLNIYTGHSQPPLRHESVAEISRHIDINYTRRMNVTSEMFTIQGWQWPV
jgi:hypothetical protein